MLFVNSWMVKDIFDFFLQIVEERSKLPISSFKDVITSTVDSNQVISISYAHWFQNLFA